MCGNTMWAELEGIFRHIYSKDRKANRLNVER